MENHQEKAMPTRSDVEKQFGDGSIMGGGGVPVIAPWSLGVDMALSRRPAPTARWCLQASGPCRRSSPTRCEVCARRSRSSGAPPASWWQTRSDTPRSNESRSRTTSRRERPSGRGHGGSRKCSDLRAQGARLRGKCPRTSLPTPRRRLCRRRSRQQKQPTNSLLTECEEGDSNPHGC